MARLHSPIFPSLIVQYQTPHSAAHRIHGPALTTLTEEQLILLGVTNNIIKRKFLRWIKEGFNEFTEYLEQFNAFDNKENIVPLQHKQTTDKGVLKEKQSWKHSQEEGMVIRSCDGSLAAYYVIKERLLKIGRSQGNVIRSLEVSVEP